MNNLREYVKYLRYTHPELFQELLTVLPRPPNPVNHQIGKGHREGVNYIEHPYPEASATNPEEYVYIAREYEEMALRGIKERGIEAIAW